MEQNKKNGWGLSFRVILRSRLYLIILGQLGHTASCNRRIKRQIVPTVLKTLVNLSSPYRNGPNRLSVFLPNWCQKQQYQANHSGAKFTIWRRHPITSLLGYFITFPGRHTNKCLFILDRTAISDQRNFHHPNLP